MSTMESEFYYREQILANCRWYYSQDVQLITMRNTTSSTWSALVMPPPSTLKSVAQADNGGAVLVHVTSRTGRLDALKDLLDKVETLIRTVYSHGVDQSKFIINKSQIPAGLLECPGSGEQLPLFGSTPRVDVTEREAMRDEIDRALAAAVAGMLERLVSSRSRA